MTAPRTLSLSSLSALHVPPPDLVRQAAAAGFDAMGALRLNRASDGSGHDLLDDAVLRRRTAAALVASGLPVLDVEVVRIRAGTRAVDVEPLLAAGAELGARFVLCTVEDGDDDRRAAALAELCALAATYSLRCMVEPMVFAAVRTPAEAVALVQRAGGGAGVLVDALHLERAGCSPADLDELDPALLPYAQVCDAAVRGTAASREAAVSEARASRLAPGTGVLPLRDLLQRLPGTAGLSVEAPGPAAEADPGAWVRHLAAATRRLLASP